MAAWAEVPNCHLDSVGEGATNALHVEFPPGKSLGASTALLRRFGEIASINLLPYEEQFAIAVVYFDVRAAELACQALGSDACRRAPQAGSRTVRLPGDVQLDVQECNKIASIKLDEQDNCTFVVEFFDIRDALRFQEAGPTTFIASPPGLAPALPPQLAEAVRPQKAASSSPAQPRKSTYHVVLEELPNNILSKPMIEAVLQQAGLDSAVLHCSTHPGKKCGRGRAVVQFSSKHAAQRCVHHFHGCSWDTSASVVTARIEAHNGASEQPKLKTAKAQCLLSADAPEFVPISIEQQASPVLKLRTTSETSTDAGESSELEDTGLLWPPGLQPGRHRGNKTLTSI